VSRTENEGAAILDKASPGFILMARLLIGLIALLLVVIPWSERYSLLDNFPHGQDTELNLLALVVVLGLILLIVRSSARRVRRVLAFRSVAMSMVRRVLGALPETRHARDRTEGTSPPLPASPGDTYNLPLQI
jgi:hypothetical protein